MTVSLETGAPRGSRPPGVKERILSSAIVEFGEVGYHRSSLRRIAELSRATKPMIYYHYQGKDGLFAAAVGDQLGQLEERLQQGISQRGDAVGRLETFARLYLSCFLRDFPGLAVGLRELPTLPAPVFEEIAEAHSRLVVAILKQILRDGEVAGELRPLDVDNCARAIIGIMHYYIRGIHGEVTAAIAAATAQVVDYYAVGLLMRGSGTLQPGR
jgi:AcrR family transcriptional regulator